MRIETALAAAGAMAALALGAMSVGTAMAQSGNAQVVVINIQRVVQESQAGQDMRTKLKALMEQKQREFRTQNEGAANAVQAEGRVLQPQLEGKTQQQIAAQPDLKNRVESLMRRQQDLAQKSQIFEASMQQTEQKAADELLRLLDPVVGQVMTQRGATIVLNAQGGIAKASPSVDITQEVTTRFNASNPRAPQPTWAPYIPPAPQPSAAAPKK